MGLKLCSATAAPETVVRMQETRLVVALKTACSRWVLEVVVHHNCLAHGLDPVAAPGKTAVVD